MTTCVFVILAFLVMGAGCAKANDAPLAQDPEYFPIGPAYKWTYQRTDNLLKFSNEFVETITEIQNEKPNLVTFQVEVIGKAPTVLEKISITRDGVLRHEGAGRKVSPPALFLKFPITIGAKWKETYTIDGISFTNNYKYSREKVTVPAGEFDAVVVTVDNFAGTYKTWYASGVGKVKVTIKVINQDLLVELISFKKE